jgi:hypothetical protein
MKKRSDGGFTLLEIMLALVITAGIFLLLFSALRLGHRSQEKGMERDEISQHIRILNDRLAWLIRGAYPYSIKIEGEETLQFEGSAGSLGFVTTSTDIYSEDPEDAAGLKWVTIYSDGGGLRMKERIFFMGGETAGEEEKELVLDPDVTGIAFKYLDLGGAGEGGEEAEEEGDIWVEVWDTEEKDYLPAAIKADITLTILEKEIQLPPVLARVRAGYSPLTMEEATR